jgi:glyoxylase-like metal-dependent hydrolase (beta-lactamase superfamily II)
MRVEVEEVADRVFNVGTKWVNCHLVMDDGQAILVDAGYPRYEARLDACLDELGLTLDAIKAVFVTHHHVDHVGVAERVRSAAGATVYVGEGDAAIVQGKRPSHPPAGFWREWWRPSMLGYLTHSARNGGARYRPVANAIALGSDQDFDLPGRPRVVHTPGHTAGHYSVVLEDRSVLVSGDAMANFDYASGKRGLSLHRFNEDRERALRSLGRLDSVDVETVVFGHGDPYTHGSRRAVDAVREAVDGGGSPERIAAS